MNIPSKTNPELIEEISLLKQRVRDLENLEAQREKAQDALRESEEKYRILLSESPDPTFSFTPQGQYTYVNKAFALGVGRPVEDIIGKTIWDVFSKEEADKRFTPLSQVFRTGAEKIIEVRVPRPDGDRYYITTITPIKDTKGETISAICSSKDITDRKRMEEALQMSEERFKSIVATSPDWIWAIDIEGRHTFSNMEGVNILGYHSAELIGQSALHLLHEEDAPKVKDLLTRSIAQKIGWSNQVIRWKHKEGTYHYLESNAVPIIDKNGVLKGFQGSDRDITERMRMEEVLRESEEQLRVLSENIADGMVYQINSGTDGQQRFFSYVSPAVEWLHGLKAEDVQLTPSLIYDQVDKAYRALVVKAEARAFETMSKLEIDVPVRLPSGDVRWRRFISSPRTHSDGSIIWDGIELDITQQKQAEEERLRLQQRLQQAEKMEALGTLAGGVAHDLNNVLGILVGYSELLLINIPEGSPLRNHIEKMMKGGVRAAAIVQDLLTLARRGVHAESVTNLNAIITDFQRTPEFENLHASYPNIRIQIKLAQDLLNIKGSVSHISKTFMNLLTNALEAIPKGGMVTVTTGNRNLDKPIHGYDDIREGDYVMLAVSDTGEGIADKDLKHIFEPFYSKKVMGRSGTGLGLAVVWGTVKDHQGYIDVQSVKGKGTTLSLYFPVTREALSVSPAAVPLSDYIGHDESIMVVDDIQEQRELASMILGNLNYRVTTAASGEAAVEYLKSHQVDLIILDMIMDPGIDGLDTYKRILEIHPKQKAVIVSGFSESDRVQAAQALGAGPYLRKPYIMEKLGITIRKELDRAT